MWITVENTAKRCLVVACGLVICSACFYRTPSATPIPVPQGYDASKVHRLAIDQKGILVDALSGEFIRHGFIMVRPSDADATVTVSLTVLPSGAVDAASIRIVTVRDSVLVGGATWRNNPLREMGPATAARELVKAASGGMGRP